MDTDQDVTPKQVASDIQACINQARNALCEISCLSGDEWPEMDDDVTSINEALDRMEALCDKVREEDSVTPE